MGWALRVINTNGDGEGGSPCHVTMDGFAFLKLLKIYFVCSDHPCIRQGWTPVRSKRKEVSGMIPGTGSVEQHYAQDEAILGQAQRKILLN